MQTDKAPSPDTRELWHRIAVRSAFVAATFSVVISALLVYEYCLRPAEDPLESVDYTSLKAILLEQPENEEIRGAISEIDFQLRKQYFRQRTFAAVGVLLLAGGIAVCLIAARSAATLRRKLPLPEARSAPVDLETQWTQVGRWSVAVLAGLLIAVTGVLWYSLNTDLPQDSQELAQLLRSLSTGRPSGAGIPDNGDSAKPPNDSTPSDGGNGSPNPIKPYPPPSAEEIGKNWHRFRGPGGRGISAYTNVPESWDGTSGEGILWKTPVPLPGNNSPVVWGNRVFLTGANETERKVFCFDADSGKILWQKEVNAPDTPAEPAKTTDDTGYAAPTATTDGRLVFAMFANGEVAAFDYEGNLAWARNLGLPENSYGHASSLTMYRDLVLVQFDQGPTAKAGKSKFYALENITGKTRWAVSRPVPNSWTTPVVICHQGRHQVIACGDPWVIAYNPENGEEFWRAKVLSGDCGPSPVIAGGLLQVGNEYCQWSAIRGDGEGDVTETHVEWTAEDGLPDVCSPLATDEFVFLMPSTAYFTCLDTKTGELLWEYEFEEDLFTSSPSLVGNRIYLFAVEGRTFILEFDRTGAKEVGRAELGEECVTSPAFQDGRIYIRGETHLFCIGQ